MGLLLCAPVFAADLDVTRIVQASIAANTADWQAQPGYVHRAVTVKSKVDSDGRSKVEQARTVQALMIDGSPYERLVAYGDRALTSDEQKQEQQKLENEIARRRSQSTSERQARIAKYESGRAEEHLLMQQMVEAFRFQLVGSERVNGVDCYVLDATPNPSYQPPVEKARVLLGMKGRLWIDKDHFHWARVQAEVINPVSFGLFIAKVKPGTKFSLEQEPIGGVWLPKRFTQTVNASVFGCYGVRTAEEDLYSDYRPLRAPIPTTAAGELAAR